MKKRNAFIVALLGLLLVPFMMFAQEVPEPTDVYTWFGLLPTYLGSALGVYVSAPFWVAILLGVTNLNEASKTTKYVFTGVVTLILCFMAFFIPFGYLHGAYWWWILVNFVGLMVAEILGYALIKAALDKIAEKFNPWKPSPPA